MIALFIVGYLVVALLSAIWLGRGYQYEIDNGYTPNFNQIKSPFVFGVAWGLMWPFYWLITIGSIVVSYLFVPSWFRWLITGKKQ